MLHVILHILAVIGIILLCILGLVLLLILLVLFVPIRYRIKGSKTEADLQLSVRVSYLLHMLSARFDYPEKGRIIVRLFGIKLYDSGRLVGKESEEEAARRKAKEEKAARKAAKKAAKRAKAKKKCDDGETAVTEATGSTPDNGRTADATADAGGTSHTADAENTDKEADTAQTEATEDMTQEEKINFLKHPIKWFQALIAKIKYTIASICDKIKNIKDKIVSIFENFSYYKGVLTDPKNTKFYGRVKERVFKILKSIRPRVLKANLHIGTGSPDSTGYLCGVYGMLLSILGKNVHIQPDFEEKVVEGTFFAKGRITIFTILVQVLKVLFDKQLRIFIKELKREE